MSINRRAQLHQLEAESIFLTREVAAQFERPDEAEAAVRKASPDVVWEGWSRSRHSFAPGETPPFLGR